MGRKKSRDLTRQERRRMRTQQVLLSLIAILVIASFVISLVTR